MKAVIRFIKAKLHPMVFLSKNRFTASFIANFDFSVWAAAKDIPFKYNVNFFRDINHILGVFERETKTFDVIKYLANQIQNVVFFDIGANLGFFSWWVLANYPQAKIFLFEPNSAFWNNIEKTIKLNNFNNVRLLKFAISDKNEAVLFKIDKLDGSTSTIVEGEMVADERLYAREAETAYVQCKPLDDLVENGNIEIPNLIKIDVEGAEDLVFKGGIKTLKKYHPLIVAEIRLQKLKIIRELIKDDYDIFYIEDIGKQINNYLLIPHDKQQFLNSGLRLEKI